MNELFRGLVDEFNKLVGGPKVTIASEIEACIPCVAAVETGKTSLLTREGKANFQEFRRRYHSMEPRMLDTPDRPSMPCCPICKERNTTPRHRMKIVETYHAKR